MNLRKILAIKLRSLGDTVIMTAPLIELTHAFPRSEIHVVVTKAWGPLLEGIPGIHKIWTYEPHLGKLARARALAILMLRLRKEKYDCVVNFHASPSSATLALATGAQARSIHFHGHRDRNRYSTFKIPGKGVLKPIIERDMDTIRALGIHVPAGRSPHLSLQPSEIQEADILLEKLRLESPTLGISLGASRPTKCWPLERFASLAIEWCQRTGGSALAFGGPSEEHLIQNFLKLVDDLLLATIVDPKARSKIRGSIAAINNLNLRPLAATLSRISVLAGNDSGPKHMAVAVNTPTVTLFGPEHPFEWHPYPPERHPYHFVEPLPCRQDADPGMPAWCGIRECIIEEHKCMRLIGVDPVLASCQRVARK